MLPDAGLRQQLGKDKSLDDLYRAVEILTNGSMTKMLSAGNHTLLDRSSV